MSLLVVHVHVQVKPEAIEAFKQATLANAQASVKEPGIARFDVVQQSDDPTRFVLIEVYRTPAAPAAHTQGFFSQACQAGGAAAPGLGSVVAGPVWIVPGSGRSSTWPG